MIFDADTERATANRDFDVCVIGSGPAGITLARRLAASGASVALMEGGDYDFSERSQAIYRGDNIGLDYFALDGARVRQFGGSSNHWGGWTMPLSPIDFVAKPQTPMSGWPIDETALAPYALETDDILDLPPAIDPPASVRDVDPRFREVYFRFSPPTRFRDKFGPEIIASARISLFLNANLVDLTLSDTRRDVTSATFRGFEAGDPGFSITARAYALCCGGIENARLLLNFDRQVPGGIGNRHDLVGRYFAEHPHFATADVVLETALPEHRFFAITEAFLLDAGLQNSLVNLDPRAGWPLPGLTTAAHRSLRCALPPFADRLAAQVLGNTANCNAPALGAWWSGTVTSEAVVRFNQEQTPNPDSRVLLAQGRDALGLRTVALDWRLSDLDVYTMRTVSVAFGAYIARRGMGRARVRDWLMADPVAFPGIAADEVAGWHHIGTTRMAETPSTGVVNRNCRVWGIGNLYVGGSSVFSTGGFANPTYSIVQMSLRLGDHLTEQLANGGNAVQSTQELVSGRRIR